MKEHWHIFSWSQLDSGHRKSMQQKIEHIQLDLTTQCQLISPQFLYDPVLSKTNSHCGLLINTKIKNVSYHH